MPINNPGWFGLGVAISPNNRFLYASFTVLLFQLDLQAPDVIGSLDTVGVYDGTDAPFPAIFHTSQLAPDGKIYISCGNGDTVYHVIERPDEKGDSCSFKQHSLNLPSPSRGIPNFPNYRLGALPGSPCDTITSISPQSADREHQIKVYPNPATDMVMVDYGFTDWSKGAVTLQLTNALGQVVFTQNLPLYSGFQKLNISPYPAGTYRITLHRGTQTIATATLVKE